MLEGHHYQNAYLTRDVDKWVRHFESHTQIDRLLTYEGSVIMETPDGHRAITNKIAFIWIGDLQYELIQPGPDSIPMYEAGLPDDDSLRFHHICMRVPDWNAFRAGVDRQPYPIVAEGGNEALRFIFLDARAFLGHFLEYTCMTDERWTQIGGTLPQA